MSEYDLDQLFAEDKDLEEIYEEIYKSLNGNITKVIDTVISICRTVNDLTLKAIASPEDSELKQKYLQLIKRYSNFVNWFEEEKLKMLRFVDIRYYRLRQIYIKY